MVNVAGGADGVASPSPAPLCATRDPPPPQGPHRRFWRPWTQMDVPGAVRGATRPAASVSSSPSTFEAAPPPQGLHRLFWRPCTQMRVPAASATSAAPAASALTTGTMSDANSSCCSPPPPPPRALRRLRSEGEMKCRDGTAAAGGASCRSHSELAAALALAFSDALSACRPLIPRRLERRSRRRIDSG